MGGCFSTCWAALCGQRRWKDRSSEQRHPLLAAALHDSGEKRSGSRLKLPVHPPRGDGAEASKHGFQALEKRLERRFSSKKNLGGLNTSNLLGHGHRDVTADYELGHLLGQGAFGVVRLATHRRTRDRYACKTILKSQLHRAVEVEDVKREVAILQLLSSHPNVAALVATYEDSSTVNLILELCEGGELFDRIAQQGSLTEREAARFFTAMVEVVLHCHRLGIMHRDIKPENFLLSSSDDKAVVRAADFGLSQFFRPGKRFHSLVGSAFYVAPEVLRRDYGPSADIWSLGVCLYILLSGLTPFWGETEEDIFRMVLEAELDFDTPPWPHVSRAAKDLVRRMLSRNAEKRPTAQEILRHPWLLRAAPDVQLDSVVIQRMRNFAALNKVKRAAMLVAVQGLSQDDIPELHALFHRLDTDKSGRLSPEEFRLGMQSMGAHMSQEDLQALVAGADIDGDGEIDYAEFVAATLGQTYARREDFVRALFQRFDADASGFISGDELRERLCGYGVSGSEVDVVLHQADTDGDNQISFDEFVTFMTSNSGSIQEAVRRKLSSHFSRSEQLRGERLSIAASRFSPAGSQALLGSVVEDPESEVAAAAAAAGGGFGELDEEQAEFQFRR